MNNILETFEIHSQHDNNYVCKMDPMLFLLVIMIVTIFLYIIQFKIK